jgi:Flp pilus assembly CpaE family ATPase
MLDAARNLHRLDESLWRGLVSRSPYGIDVLPAPVHAVLGETARPDQLVEILQFAMLRYRWIVADLGQVSTAALGGCITAFRNIQLVATPEFTSLHQAKRFIRQWQNAGSAGQVKLVINRLRKGQIFSHAEVEKILSTSIELVLREELEEFEDANAGGRLLSPRCELAKGAAVLAGRIAQLPSQPRPSVLAAFRTLLPASAAGRLIRLPEPAAGD